jgi:hypothetical protein
MCRRRVLVRVVLLWLALAATASAQPRTETALVWQAPHACPDVGEVRARIERRLGSPLDAVVQGVAVEISPDGEGGNLRFVARIDLRAVTVANEIRVLTSARCDELTDAVAVVIARIASEKRQAAAGRGEVARIATHEPPPLVSRLWGGGMRALGVSGVGATPGIGLGGEVAAYLRRRSLFVELAGARWMPTPRVLYMGAPGRVDVGLFVAVVRFGWGPERLPLRAWISTELGSIHGQGLGFDDAPAGTARWAGLGGGFGVAWPMTQHTRLIGIVEVVAPLQRARFVLEHGTEVYRPDMATARCGFGLEIGWR